MLAGSKVGNTEGGPCKAWSHPDTPAKYSNSEPLKFCVRDVRFTAS